MSSNKLEIYYKATLGEKDSLDLSLVINHTDETLKLMRHTLDAATVKSMELLISVGRDILLEREDTREKIIIDYNGEGYSAWYRNEDCDMGAFERRAASSGFRGGFNHAISILKAEPSIAKLFNIKTTYYGE